MQLLGHKDIHMTLRYVEVTQTSCRSTTAQWTFCWSPLLLGLIPVGAVASAVENASAAYFGTSMRRS
jgi:hypothetical protein